MNRFFLTSLITFCSMVSLAQPGNPNNPDPDVPITGIEILLSVGALFGAKKLLKNSKQK